ncbi:hypothetical protein QJQ45_004295 [Haematococcus lacustris]|nr:hypothetical protein QJQ45_004295 [Haematococcus lacustris]
MVHFQLRAEVHSQLRVIASLFLLRIFLTCLVGYPTPGYSSAPTPPAVQPPRAQDAAPLPPLPLRVPAQPASMAMDWDTEPEPDPDPAPAPPTLRPPSARLVARHPPPAAPTGPPMPLDSEDPVMLQQLQVFCEYFANSNKLTPYNQLQRRLGRPRQVLHYSMKVAFDDPSNQELLAKLQQLGSVTLTGDHNTISHHSKHLAAAMQQHYSNPGKPRGTDQLRGRVVLVDEHRTSRVSSAVNGQQPCESRLSKRRATRPADWKPPAGQVEHRLVRPAWSQQRDQPVRGMMWCPVGAPRKPPQPPCSSQEAPQPAASEPGPSAPLPAKRSKRTKAEPAAEPTKGKGKAAKAKPAPQPGRWLDRGCNAALNMQHIGESRALPAKGKEYPGLGYKRVRDKPPKAQQQQQ